MKIEIIGESRVIIENRESDFNYFGWPTVARLKDGRIAVACSGYRLAHVCPFGKAVMAVSEDEGKTFSSPVPVIDTCLDDRDAGLCPFGESGLILTSFNNTVAFQRGAAADDPRCRAYLDTVAPEDEKAALGSEFRVSYDNGRTWGRIFHAPITSPHGPVETRDGRVLWVGRLFSEKDRAPGTPVLRVAEVDPASGNVTEIGGIADVIEDGVTPYFCEPHMLELPSGRLLCHIRENVRRTTWQSESDDGGRTWSTAHPLMPPNGGYPSHLFRHSSGMLIATYGRREVPYGLYAMFSRDDGATWETGVPLDVGYPSDDLAYPSTVELRDGSLLTAYYAPTGPWPSSCVIRVLNWCFDA